MNRVYVSLALLSMLFFRSFRFINNVLEIKFKQEKIESMNSLIVRSDINKGSKYNQEEEDEVMDKNKGKLEDMKEEMEEGAGDVNKMPDSQRVSSQIVPPLELVQVKKPNSDDIVIKTKTIETKKEKDFFKTFFCREFDSILKLNRVDSLNVDNEIKDPLILELKDYINIKKLQSKWAQSKSISKKELIFKKLKIAGNWLLKYFKILVWGLLGFIKNFFTNQFIVIFLETIIACIYVIYSERLYSLLPIILWIFLNVYPRYDSSGSLNLKIWLLMIPTGINSLLSKRTSNNSTQNSKNPDFSFSYKSDYQFLDISALGIVLIGFVVLEMILLTNMKNVSRDLIVEPNTQSDSSSNKLFATLATFITNNAFYLIIINLYFIALDINIINLGLIIYFIKLILTRKMTKKTMYTLCWYNQFSILLRYCYETYLEQDKTNLNTNQTNLLKLIGLMEPDGFDKRTKIILNFVLQLLLIINIFKFRNQDLFNKMQAEHTKDKMRKVFSTSSLKQSIQNLIDYAEYSTFHCLPWLSYFFIYLSMIVTSTTIVTLLELFFLCYLLIKHLKLSIDNRFGGLHLMRGSWKFMIGFSAFSSLSRYIIWFATQEYIRERSSFIKKFYETFTGTLGFVGIIPQDQKQAYLELLPSFLSMYLGSLILSRIRLIEYTIENEKEIMGLDLEEVSEAPVIELDFDAISYDSQRRSRKSTIFRGKSVVQHNDEIKLRLNKEDIDHIQERNQKMRSKKIILGHINALK